MDNGYIAIDVNGEKLGIKFGMPANQEFSQKVFEGAPFKNPAGSVNSEGVAYLIYCGYKNNCDYKDAEVKYTPGYFREWVDDVSIDPEREHILTEIGDCYFKSKYTKAWQEKLDKALENLEDEKKKMIGSISNPSVTESLG